MTSARTTRIASCLVLLSIPSLAFFHFPITTTRATRLLATTVTSTDERLLQLGVNSAEYPNDDLSHILGIDDPNHIPSKLQSICNLRLKDVTHSKLPLDVNGCGIDRSFYISEDDLRREIEDFDEQYGKPLNLIDRIKVPYPTMAIAAEFKRASPSKGDINMGADIIEQCMTYANVGAAVISVLTEFTHFKGTLEDMKRVRLSTQQQLGESRPAILRKDFILDRYQVYEARANGADTLLLIVAVLGVSQLRDLVKTSRSLGMEPLVEVHTEQEMNIALDCGARVIGVNNRNLHTFQLDLETTGRAVAIAATRGFTWRPSARNSAARNSADSDLQILALSGITSAADVAVFRDMGVACCLIGETLMKATDPAATVRQLLGDVSTQSTRMVKVCGITRPQDASSALQHGARLIGLIFAPKSPRVSSTRQAIDVVEVVRKYGERTSSVSLVKDITALKNDQLTSALWFSRCAVLLEKVTLRRPLTVGVFQDQSVEEINRIVEETGLDLVQLHGGEGVDVADALNVPCIKVLHVSSTESTETMLANLAVEVDVWREHAIALLLDTSVRGERGGTGVAFDWSIASRLGVPVMLAGGINPSNAAAAGLVAGVVGLDVSSGVESAPGVKDPTLVEALLRGARNS